MAWPISRRAGVRYYIVEYLGFHQKNLLVVLQASEVGNDLSQHLFVRGVGELTFSYPIRYFAAVNVTLHQEATREYGAQNYWVSMVGTDHHPTRRKGNAGHI